MQGSCVTHLIGRVTDARLGGLQPQLEVDISAKRGPTAQWVAKDIVQNGIRSLFKEFLHTLLVPATRGPDALRLCPAAMLRPCSNAGQRVQCGGVSPLCS